MEDCPVNAAGLPVLTCGACENGRLPVDGRIDYLLSPASVPWCSCDYGQLFRARARGDNGWQRFREEVAQSNRERGYLRLFAQAGIPGKYGAYTFDKYCEIAGGDPGKHKAIAAVAQYFETGAALGKSGIMLYGATDMGKTGMLSPLFTHLIEQGYSGIWIQFEDWKAEMRRFEDGNVDARIQAAKTCDFLFIDDMGRPEREKAETDYSKEPIFRVLSAREAHDRPVFITSNLTATALADYLHPAAARRIQSMCACVEVSGRTMTELRREAA